MKKILIAFVIAVVLTACGTSTYKGAILTVKSINTYNDYSNIEFIVNQNSKVFTELELTNLRAISTEFHSIYFLVESLLTNTNTLTDIFIDPAQFEKIYNMVVLNYRKAKAIIQPKLVYFPMKDQFVVTKFDRDTLLLDAEIRKFRTQIKEAADGTEIDATKVLSDVLTFAGAFSKILAVSL